MEMQDSGVGSWGRGASSRLVSGVEVDSSIYTGNWVVVEEFIFPFVIKQIIHTD